MGSKKTSEAPVFTQSPGTKELESLLLPRTKELAGMDFEDFLSRFTVDEGPLTEKAIQAQLGLTVPEPMGFEDFLGRFTPERGEFRELAETGVKGLFEDRPGGFDFEKESGAALDLITRKFKEERGEAFDPVRERLIAENLFTSGPGFKKEAEFRGETAQGVTDITTAFAFENINRKITERNYQDALLRGDIETAFNIALQSEQQQVQAATQATTAANLDREFTSALERGDIQQAFNIGQIIRQNKLTTQTLATEAEFGALRPAQELFGQLSAKDLSKFEAQQRTFEAERAGKGSFGGLGQLLGMGAGALLALPTGGMSVLAGAQLGGAFGGATGSLFET